MSNNLRTIYTNNQSGITLIELLISIAIVSLVLSLGYTLYTSLNNTFVKSESRSDIRQNVRLAANFITQELRYATHIRIFDNEEVDFEHILAKNFDTIEVFPGDTDDYNFIYVCEQGFLMFREARDGETKDAVQRFGSIAQEERVNLTIEFEFRGANPPSLLYFKSKNKGTVGNDKYYIESTIGLLNTIENGNWHESAGIGIAVAYKNNRPAVTEIMDVSSSWDTANLEVFITYTRDLMPDVAAVTPSQFQLENNDHEIIFPDHIEKNNTDQLKLIFYNYDFTSGGERKLYYHQDGDTSYRLKDDNKKNVKSPDEILVMVEFREKFTGNSIIDYLFPGIQVGDSLISEDDSLIIIQVPVGTDLTNIVAKFVLSIAATAYVNGIPQISGETPNDFSNTIDEPFYYTVRAENGNEREWRIAVFVSIEEGGDGLVLVDGEPVPFQHEIIELDSEIIILSGNGYVTMEESINFVGETIIIESGVTFYSDTNLHTINIDANQDILIEESVTFNLSQDGQNSISLNSSNGNIILPGVNLSSSGNAGDPDQIDINAYGNIDIRDTTITARWTINILAGGNILANNASLTVERTNNEITIETTGDDVLIIVEQILLDYDGPHGKAIILPIEKICGEPAADSKEIQDYVPVSCL